MSAATDVNVVDNGLIVSSCSSRDDSKEKIFVVDDEEFSTEKLENHESLPKELLESCLNAKNDVENLSEVSSPDLNADDDFSLENDYICNELEKKDGHVFILSEAGKPIFSRHGSEEKLVTLFGVIQAMVSVIQDMDDAIDSIQVGKDTSIVFFVQEPLIIAGVTRTGLPKSLMKTKLLFFYNQVVSTLTSKQLVQIFEKRRNYDLRRLLSGSERLMNNLGDLIENDPSFLIGAIRCLPLSFSVRENISNAISQVIGKLKQNVIFAILISNNQLISLVRMKKYYLQPMDLHLIFNLVDSTQSFKTAESWTPLCLPKFDSHGFLHAHISYLTDDYDACLVMMTDDRDSFFALSDAKKKIVEKLEKNGSHSAINTAMRNHWPKTSYINIPQIRHFLYKSRPVAQFFEPVTDLPYRLNEPGNPNLSICHIYDKYYKMKSRLQSHSKPLSMIYQVCDHENFMGWITADFELYVTLEPLISKSSATDAVNKLMKWIKKEEDKVFILNWPTL